MKLELRTIAGSLIFGGDFSCKAKLLEAAIDERKSLRDAYLRDAYLRDAYLSGANLRDANLRGANLSSVKNDYWEILLRAKREVPFLRAALMEGRVDGSTYYSECACLVGTIANARGCRVDSLEGIAVDHSRPAERFFLAIQPGCTPDKSQHAKLAIEWLDEWQALMNDDKQK